MSKTFGMGPGISKDLEVEVKRCIACCKVRVQFAGFLLNFHNFHGTDLELICFSTISQIMHWIFLPLH